MLGVAFGIGFILGPAVGGILGSYNVHYPFWAAAAMSLLKFRLRAFYFCPESPQAGKSQPFFLGHGSSHVGSVKLLVSHHELWGLGLVTFLSQLAHTSLPAIYVLYAGYRYGWGPDQVGFLLAGVGVASMVVQGGLVQPIVKRIGERPALLLGLLCGGIGLTWDGTAWIGVLTWIGVPIAAFWGLFKCHQPIGDVTTRLCV